MNSPIPPRQLPSFETTRLLIRPVSLDDLEAYERHFVDYEVIRYLSKQVPWPYPADGVETFLKEQVLPFQGQDKWNWGLHLRTKPSELIGMVGLWRAGRPEHRGFWLGRRFWGQGLMTEAVVPIMDYAFDALGFETLIFSNACGNIGSRRVKEKTGAKLIRVEPGQLFVDPELSGQELWELSKRDWRHHQKHSAEADSPDR